MQDNHVQVRGCPHPFRPEARIDAVVPHGATVEEIVTRGLDSMHVPPALRGCGHAFIGGEYIPHSRWADTVPPAGALVTYRIVPQGGGGGGDKALRGLLTVAVMFIAVMSQQYYLAAYGTTFTTAAGVTSYTTGSMLASAAVATAVTAAGTLAINSLVPVRARSLSSGTTPDAAGSPTYSISGARNSLSPFGVIPMILGRHRIVPPQCARPYTEIVGNDQYVRQLFLLGYAPLEIAGPFKIGETEISSFADVQLEVIPAATKDTRPLYYTNDVYEDGLSIQLKNSGGWQLRTTKQACDRLDIDLSFPRGLVRFNDRAVREGVTVQLEAQYAPTGSGAWQPLGGPLYVGASSHNIPIAQRQVSSDSGFSDGTWYTNTTWEPAAQWHTVSANSMGHVHFSSGQPGNDWAPGVPAGYMGIMQVRAVGKQITHAMSIAPAGSGAVTWGFAGNSRGGWVLTVNPTTLPFTTLNVSGCQTSALRRTVGVDVPTGKYDVRVRRLSGDTDDSKIADESWWAALRATRKINPIRHETPLCAVSLRIRATGQLNGAVDELNCVVQSVCLDYDRTTRTWVNRPTSNPASLFRHVLQHPGNKRAVPDSQIDLAQLAVWHEFCRTHNLRYNRVHDYAASVFEVLQDVAAAGRAGVSQADGQWGVVIDDVRSSVVQHFTPRNSWGFKSTKALPRRPHGWRIRFVDEAQGYAQDERIVYADGYDEATATEFEQLELPGVTNAEQVWQLGRHHLACAMLRPEEYELWADMEHIVCTRGDLIRVAHDVPLWGLAQGRVKSVVAILDGAGATVGHTLTVDEPVTMEQGKRYSIRWRSAVGASHLRDVVTAPGETRTITLSGGGAAPEKGDLWMFGTVGEESAELIVKTIEPAENLSARLVCVDYSPAIFDAAKGAIPPFNSHTTLPGGDPATAPPAPVVTSIRSDEAVLVRQASGALAPRIAVDYTAAGGMSVQVRVRPVGGSWRTAGTAEVSDGVVYADGVVESVEHEVCIRTVSRLGIVSGWTAPIKHTVIGRTTPPPAPSGVYLDGTRVYWTMPDATPIDVAGWEVLMGMDDTDPIERALLLTTGLLTERRFDVGPWAGRARRVFVRTVDAIGLRSPAVSAVIALGDEPVANVVQTVSEAAQGWPGTLTGGIRLAGRVEASGSRQMWGATPMWGASTLWGDTYQAVRYSASHTVPAGVEGARLHIDPVLTSGSVVAIEYAHGPRRQMWGATPMWGTDSMWGGIVPTEWHPMPDSIPVATGDELYIRVTTHDRQQAVLTDITWTYDVEDAELSLDGVAVPAGGMRLPVPAGLFRWIKTATFGLEYATGGTAVSVRYLDKGIISGGRVTAGPLVQCIDQSGASVAGRIDARIQGAGG